MKGNFVDVWNKEIYTADILVKDSKINAIYKIGKDENLPFVLPGFTDAHVHIESSMLLPSEFAKLAVVHGTIATVSDPHEIANVCGLEGVRFMIENGNKVPFRFYFGAPSCVPATHFETAGATLNSTDVTALLQQADIHYLSEMMNFPGVLHQDEEVMKKINIAHELKKPVDGHAPGLRGKEAKQYIAAGITTDHECMTGEEALEKLGYGMKILIREGSAARNFDALITLLNDHFENMMFCSDDKHPDSLEEGHINVLCKRAVAKGIDVFKVLRAACINPVLHYNLHNGLLRVGDAADFILVDNLTNFNVLKTYINGELVAEKGTSFIKSVEEKAINHFSCNEITANDLLIAIDDYPHNKKTIPVIEALDGELITNKLMLEGKEQNGYWVSDVERDILKMVVVNRYQNAPVAKCFIKNFGLKKGAIASSVAHDSHNIIAVGCDDESLAAAINIIVKNKGGISCAAGDTIDVLPLPVAGLMSDKDGYEVAKQYTAITRKTKSLGSGLAAPFMTLSFMALLVIPHLKLSDKGLFDGDTFDFVQ
ncbi:MAG: adenine deaminase [Bacteroidota bacterium]|nr:adenine deaminase [Bacteroidota bacterium]